VVDAQHSRWLIDSITQPLITSLTRSLIESMTFLLGYFSPRPHAMFTQSYLN
jgi:hypothetical protein